MPVIKCRYGFNCSLMLMMPGLTAKDCPNNQVCGTISRLTEEEQVELARTIEIQTYFNSITNQIHHIQSVLACERSRINAEEAAIMMLKQRGAMPPIEDFCIQESIDALDNAIDSLNEAIASLYTDYVCPQAATIHEYLVKRPWATYSYFKLASQQAIFEPSVKLNKVKVIHLSKRSDSRYIEASKGLERRNRLNKIKTLIDKAKATLSEAVELANSPITSS